MVLASAWNSLEIVKLVVAVATPVLLLALGVFVSRLSRRIEDAQWSSRKLIEKRLQLYEEMAPLLNDLYCFFRRIGDFQSIDPPSLIEKKRALDKTFHINRFLFEADFEKDYNAFVDSCFLTFTGAGRPAQIRTEVAVQQRERPVWDESWASWFAPAEKASSVGTVGQLYEKLMRTFASEIGVAAPGPAD